MKKYIIGAMAGLMLSLGVGAHAEVINMIGKTIDGSFPIKINGKTLTNQAVTIEGTSYVPTREFAESLGAEVKFNADLGIEVVPISTPTPTESTTSTPKPRPTPTKEEQIKVIKAKIQVLETRIMVDKRALTESPDAPLADLWKESVATKEKQLADLQAQLDALQQ